MGVRYGLQCPDCGLSAWVSGGRDIIMAGQTETVWCPDCKVLADTLVEPHDQPPRAPACPGCERTSVRKWNLNEPCPGCGGTLVEDWMGPALTD